MARALDVYNMFINSLHNVEVALCTRNEKSASEVIYLAALVKRIFFRCLITLITIKIQINYNIYFFKNVTIYTAAALFCSRFVSLCRIFGVIHSCVSYCYISIVVMLVVVVVLILSMSFCRPSHISLTVGSSQSQYL